MSVVNLLAEGQVQWLSAPSLARAPQIDSLRIAGRHHSPAGLLRVINRETSETESRTAGIESYGQSATAARSQNGGTIVTLEVASAHCYLAEEVDRQRIREIRVVEKRNRQRGAARAALLRPKIQACARRHPQGAGFIRF